MSDPKKIDAALSRAVQQLDTAVQEQETAADRILALAEHLNKSTLLQVKAIIEACAFQDLTGQRIRKVARLIRYLQENNLISSADLPQDAPQESDGGGLTQEQVDQLLSRGGTG